MPTAKSEDTEITLGTGKMLALFFALVALCAVFFAAGFSLGKEAALKPSAAEAASAPSASAVLRPASMKTSSKAAPAAENADKSAGNQPAVENSPVAVNSNPPNSNSLATAPDPAAPPVLNGYYVQVAAVTKQEDADALVEALKSKQYPAFSAAASDKLFHVQCGPYADIKDAEGMRAKLISDGYNPILKK
jgi:DedD protein